MTAFPLTVCGVHQSFFTRKVTGYLDYKGLPWKLRRGFMFPKARAGGWPGAIPAVIDGDGEVLWDSTSLILHFEHHNRERSVLPEDHVHRFLAYLLEDFNDEWFYRSAVGSRWLIEGNKLHGSWDLARDGAHELPMTVSQTREMITGAMMECQRRIGPTPDNIHAWMTDSFTPWATAMSDHVGGDGYLFGARPSLADFAFYGGNAAHFVNDPWCWDLCDEKAPGLVAHTHRLTEPADQPFGDWLAAGDVPDTLIALIREAGRHYLPWVAEATVSGSAIVEFESGPTAEIATTEFLTNARGVMLARYAEARSPGLDEVLDAAGVLSFYADHLEQATTIPDPEPAPRPTDNRPYPAGA